MTASAARERESRIAALPLSTTTRNGLFRGSIRSVREIWRRRELLMLLIRRELKARYKDSSLGVLWSLARPLVQLLIYYFAIGQVLGAARLIPSFAIFVFIGLVAWTLFTEIAQNGTRSILDNAGLIKKVDLPREIFPIAAVGAALFNVAVQLGILLIAMLVLQQFPAHLDVLWAIPSLGLVVVFGTALAMILSALNVYFRDVEHLVEVALLVFFWLSPIVYSFGYVSDLLTDLPWVEEIYLANPVTLAVLGLQRAFWIAGSTNGANWPPELGARILIAFLASLVLLWLSQRLFARLQGNFAQEL